MTPVVRSGRHRRAEGPPVPARVRRATLRDDACADLAAPVETERRCDIFVDARPANPTKLGPEAHAPTPGSFDKDGFKNYLKREVYAGRMLLAVAQKEIASDSVTYCSCWPSLFLLLRVSTAAFGLSRARGPCSWPCAPA